MNILIHEVLSKTESAKSSETLSGRHFRFMHTRRFTAKLRPFWNVYLTHLNATLFVGGATVVCHQRRKAEQHPCLDLEALKIVPRSSGLIYRILGVGSRTPSRVEQLLLPRLDQFLRILAQATEVSSSRRTLSITRDP